MSDGNFQRQNSLRRRIFFNVSGFKFETWSDTVERFPTTLLGNENKLQSHFCFETGQYYFDRNRFAFEAVLYFFQSNGRLIRPTEISMDVFERECAFYELPDDCIDKLREKEGHLLKNRNFTPLPQPANLRGKIWCITERPESSTSAFAYNVISLAAIVLWIIASCVQTIPFRTFHTATRWWWFYIEIVFSSFFTLEYTTRLATTPTPRKFITQSMNLIDLVASVPYLVILIADRGQAAIVVLNCLRLLRPVRLFRFLKLGNSSERVRLLEKIMASSLDDIGLLFLCLMMVVLIGASLLFFTEMDVEGTQFTSVPASSWWAVQTVVVLGYGDIIPTSDVGKLFASFFMIFGALTISLPVLSVVTRLVKIYGKEMS